MVGGRDSGFERLELGGLGVLVLVICVHLVEVSGGAYDLSDVRPVGT